MGANDDLSVELHLSAEQAARGETDSLRFKRLSRAGAHLVLVDEEARIAAPPGLQEPTTLRLPGQGHERTPGVRGDLRVVVRIGSRERRVTLFLSPGEAQRGVRRTIELGEQFATTVVVPPGLDPTQVLRVSSAGGHLFVQVAIEPELQSEPEPRARLFTAERWVALGLAALAVWLLVGGFVLPLSEVGKPEIRFQPQAFAVGLVGLALAGVLGFGGDVGALRGRRRSAALVAAVLVLALGCGLTVVLVQRLEAHGYHLK